MVHATTSPSPSFNAPPATEKWRSGAARNAALLALITLVATALRFHALTAKSFWLDEGISVEIARLPWPQFFFVLRHREANMMLYYLLLRFWLAMGSGEGFIRGLSVLFSLATVPVVYVLGARLFGRSAGLLAAWLLAINAYHIRYAQEARGYALVVFFAALASWLFVRNLQEPSCARWGAYTAAGAAGVYSHFFGALIVLAHGVSLAFLPRKDLPWGDLRRSVRWFAYLMFPIALIVAAVGAGSMRWIAPAETSTVLNFFSTLAGNGGNPLLLLDAVAVCFAAIGWWRVWHSDGPSFRTWGYALVFAWLFVPVLLVLAVSVVRPLFLARYLNPCLPALILIVAAGITRLRPPVLAWVLGAAISLFSVVGTVSYYHQDFDLQRDDWRAATSYVLDRAMPGDGAFFYLNFGRLPFEFYRSQRHTSPVWPEALVSANGSDWGYRDSLFASLGEALRDAKPGGDRVWLVLTLDTDSNGQPRRESVMLRAVYGKDRHLIEEKRISTITILLYAREATASTLFIEEKTK